MLINGILRIAPWMGNYEPLVVLLGNGASLVIDGDLILGPKVRISIASGARLVIGGKENEDASRITEYAIIIVVKSVSLGRDFLGSWGLFITDGDHHQYGDNTSKDVAIGDHVWMCPNSSVLKGSIIGANSVITRGAVVTGGSFPESVTDDSPVSNGEADGGSVVAE